MRVDPFSLPLSRPLETATGTIDRREGFVVRIPYAGVEGVGEATPLPGWTEGRDACRVRLDVARTTALREDWGVALAETAMPAARHGLALALADARARADDRPLYRYLGGDERVDRVPVNATVGDADPDATARAAREAVADGIGTVKIKAGARPVETDVERVRAVRESVGTGVELRVDANAAWSREQARDAVEAFADLGVDYVEQPLAPDDLAGHAVLRGRGVDVALDESLRGTDVETVLAENAADVLVLKPMVLGGPDRARQVGIEALRAGLSAVVTTTIDAVVARTAAVHLAASLPRRPASGLATAALLASDLAPDPAPVEDGEIRVPQRPGVGVTGVEV